MIIRNNKKIDTENKMIIITPEEIVNKGTCKLGAKSVFLAGTIDNGDSLN